MVMTIFRSPAGIRESERGGVFSLICLIILHTSLSSSSNSTSRFEPRRLLHCGINLLKSTKHLYIFSLEKTSSGMSYVFCERRKIQPPLWSFGRSRPYKVFIKPFWQGKNLHSNNTIQLHVLITWCVLILYNHQEHSKYIQFEDRAFIWQRVVNASSEG